MEPFSHAQSMRKMHHFRSHSSHKLFFRTRRMYDDNGSGNGGMLDIVYRHDDPAKIDFTHERLGKTSVNYDLMTERPELVKKLGTNLNYNVQMRKTMGIGDTRRPVMGMVTGERKLTFLRQVISPERGCYR